MEGFMLVFLKTFRKGLMSIIQVKQDRQRKLIFTKGCETRIQARELEKYYKSGIGKEKLKRMVP